MKLQCGYWRCSASVGLFLAGLFVICFAWYFIRGGSAELKALHENLLALSFIGWTGMNVTSFILGLIQSFVWGYIGVGIWCLTGCCLKPGRSGGE